MTKAKELEVYEPTKEDLEDFRAYEKEKREGKLISQEQLEKDLDK